MLYVYSLTTLELLLLRKIKPYEKNIKNFTLHIPPNFETLYVEAREHSQQVVIEPKTVVFTASHDGDYYCTFLYGK